MEAIPAPSSSSELSTRVGRTTNSTQEHTPALSLSSFLRYWVSCGILTHLRDCNRAQVNQNTTCRSCLIWRIKNTKKYGKNDGTFFFLSSYFLIWLSLRFQFLSRRYMWSFIKYFPSARSRKIRTDALDPSVIEEIYLTTADYPCLIIDLHLRWFEPVLALDGGIRAQNRMYLFIYMWGVVLRDQDIHPWTEGNVPTVVRWLFWTRGSERESGLMTESITIHFDYFQHVAAKVLEIITSLQTELVCLNV